MASINYYDLLLKDSLFYVYDRRKNAGYHHNYYVVYVRNYKNPKYDAYSCRPSEFKVLFDTLGEAQEYQNAIVYLHYCDWQDTNLVSREYDTQLNLF